MSKCRKVKNLFQPALIWSVQIEQFVSQVSFLESTTSGLNARTHTALWSIQYCHQPTFCKIVFLLFFKLCTF